MEELYNTMMYDNVVSFKNSKDVWCQIWEGGANWSRDCFKQMIQKKEKEKKNTQKQINWKWNLRKKGTTKWCILI